MRLWSIHPKYLDQKGLVACWREGLLAKKVLEGRTEGYTKHPQLTRFKTGEGLEYIQYYLWEIYCEAVERGYNFDKKLIGKIKNKSFIKIPVTIGQLDYEFKHLQKKLKERNPNKYEENCNLKKEHKPIHSNSVFTAVEGDIEGWEKIK